MKKIITIALLFIALKQYGQVPSLSAFSNMQQYQLKMYVKYEVDSAGAQIKKDYSYQDYLRTKRIDSLSVALKLTNDTLNMVRKSMVKPSQYDFIVKDTVMIWNNNNFYISNGQIVRKQ